jgi:hypothetical protein
MGARLACLAILAAAVAAGCGKAPSRPVGAPGVSSPRELIETILACSRSKDYEALRPRICAIPLGPLGVLTRDVVVQHIMKQDKEKVDDFSYSDEAVEVLLKRHMDGFTSKVPDAWMKDMTDGELSTPEIRKLALDRPGAFRVFDREGVFILLAEVEGRYKLVFWTGLNRLLKT